MSQIVKFDEDFFTPFFRLPRIFEDGQSNTGLELSETDESFIAKAPVYGVEPKQIEVHVKGNILTIRGEVKREEEKKKSNKTNYSSTMQKSFYYQTNLPSLVNGSKAIAKIKNGVVTVEIPKIEEEKAKKIEIIEE